MEEIRAAGLYRELWQAFAVLLPVRTVGVMGDDRTYAQVIALRAVMSQDAMTADWARMPYDLLGTISTRIINEVHGVNRWSTTSPPSRRARSSGSERELNAAQPISSTCTSTRSTACSTAPRASRSWSKRQGARFPALALTDHGNLFGGIDFYSPRRRPASSRSSAASSTSRRAAARSAAQDGGYEGANH